MAELGMDPKSLDQAYDMGFCDGSLIRESATSELIRLRAEALDHSQLIDRCERCGLHQAVVDLAAMERQRDIWRWFGLACFVLAVLFAGWK